MLLRLWAILKLGRRKAQWLEILPLGIKTHTKLTKTEMVTQFFFNYKWPKIVPNRSSDTNWSWLVQGGGGGLQTMLYGHALQVKLDNSLYVPFTHVSRLCIQLWIPQVHNRKVQRKTLQTPNPSGKPLNQPIGIFDKHKTWTFNLCFRYVKTIE